MFCVALCVACHAQRARYIAIASQGLLDNPVVVQLGDTILVSCGQVVSSIRFGDPGRGFTMSHVESTDSEAGVTKTDNSKPRIVYGNCVASQNNVCSGIW